MGGRESECLPDEVLEGKSRHRDSMKRACKQACEENTKGLQEGSVWGQGGPGCTDGDSEEEDGGQGEGFA